MTTVYAIHAPDPAKLDAVVAEMQTLGVPTIEVVDCGDYFMALEGSHRLAAAAQLGLTPLLTVREQDDIIKIAGYDWYDACNWGGTEYTAGEVAGEIFAPSSAVSYKFD